MPVWLGNGLSDMAGTLIYGLIPAKRRAVLCNLAHAIPDRPISERHRVARAIFRNGMRNYYDMLRVHALTREERLAQIELHNLEYVYEAFKQGKGILGIAAHQGSFSFIPQIATAVNFDFYLVVEPIKPPELFELVRKLREEDPRSHTIAVGGSEVRTIFRALKGNNMVCMAIDRDVIGNGQPLTFFGAEAKLPVGVAEIALRTGVPIMPILPYHTPDGRHGVQFTPSFVVEPTGDKAADIARISSLMLRKIEEMIRLSPEDWVVLQPIWPDC